ncbi:unnamed protein product [Gongylonema pulchrum]|uniref:Golgi SNAP receptor complex member 1 n=1 Tax=Gongylonema pulchrum TaxID=637853 RepID=A0A183EHZ3_9BILA|nr:unnamed protein product [Gongylonema pulchrum]
MERPWRQRMADAARLRNAHGDEIGGAIQATLAASRRRRSSISSQNRASINSSGDELHNSLKALKNYMDDRTTVDSLLF